MRRGRGEGRGGGLWGWGRGVYNPSLVVYEVRGVVFGGAVG